MNKPSFSWADAFGEAVPFTVATAGMSREMLREIHGRLWRAIEAGDSSQGFQVALRGRMAGTFPVSQSRRAAR